MNRWRCRPAGTAGDEAGADRIDNADEHDRHVRVA
jgi:hypothetical protein